MRPSLIGLEIKQAENSVFDLVKLFKSIELSSQIEFDWVGLIFQCSVDYCLNKCE